MTDVRKMKMIRLLEQKFLLSKILFELYSYNCTHKIVRNKKVECLHSIILTFDCYQAFIKSWISENFNIETKKKVV